MRLDATHDAIRKLAAIVAGKPVVVVGAAPLKMKVQPAEGEIVIAVNGGISSTSGHVDVWQVNSRSAQFEQWGPGRRRLATLMLQQGKKRQVGLLFFIAREADAPPTTRAILGRQGTKWQGEAVVLQHTERRPLEAATGARDEKMKKDAMSAGLTAVAFALYAGAAHVRMVGFSWLPGYEYLPGERIDARGHVRADQLGLKNLLDRYAGRIEHDLVIPAHLTGDGKMPPPRTQPNTRKPETLTEAAAQAQAPQREERPGAIRVQATKLLFYGNKRVRPGEVFELKRPGDFKHNCMRAVTEEQPALRPHAFAPPKFPIPEIALRRPVVGGQQGGVAKPSATALPEAALDEPPAGQGGGDPDKVLE